MKTGVQMIYQKEDYRRTRSAILSFLVLLLFTVIVGKLFYVQVVMGADYLAIAEAQQSRQVSFAGERGIIFDRNNAVLAQNVDNLSLFVDPVVIKKKKTAASLIARATGESYKRVIKKLSGKGRYLAVARNVGWDREDAVKSVAKQINRESVRDYKRKGLFYNLGSRRFYPNRNLLAHVLGFALQDNHGLAGIEKVYDDQLSAEKVNTVYEKDARGKLIFPRGFEYGDQEFGSNLILTVDEVIQHLAESELDKVMSTSRAKGATAIVMNPDTGEILAMAVRPGFDPNNIGGSPVAHRRNRAITDVYEPGSTFKVIVGASLLEAGVIDMNEDINLEHGSLRIGRVRIRDSHRIKGKHDFATIFRESSNIGMIKLASRLDKNSFYLNLKKFGFGRKTGIDLIGEVSGILHPPKRWSKTTMPNMSIGQGIAVTPLQLAMAVSAVINGGRLMKPYIVKKIVDNNGVMIKNSEPVEKDRVVSESVSNVMKKLMVQVIERGTGKKARLSGYIAGGKTGTAQKVDPETRRYSHKLVVSSFVGFAPFEKPRLVVLVAVDEPKGVQWGGAVAGPVFKHIMERSLRYLGVPQDKDEDDEFLLASAGIH